MEIFQIVVTFAIFTLSLFLAYKSGFKLGQMEEIYSHLAQSKKDFDKQRAKILDMISYIEMEKNDKIRTRRDTAKK